MSHLPASSGGVSGCSRVWGRPFPPLSKQWRCRLSLTLAVVGWMCLFVYFAAIFSLSGDSFSQMPTISNKRTELSDYWISCVVLWRPDLIMFGWNGWVAVFGKSWHELEITWSQRMHVRVTRTDILTDSWEMPTIQPLAFCCCYQIFTFFIHVLSKMYHPESAGNIFYSKQPFVLSSEGILTCQARTVDKKTMWQRKQAACHHCVIWVSSLAGAISQNPFREFLSIIYYLLSFHRTLTQLKS